MMFTQESIVGSLNIVRTGSAYAEPICVMLVMDEVSQ